jgi:hypothetical protein
MGTTDDDEWETTDDEAEEDSAALVHTTDRTTEENQTISTTAAAATGSSSPPYSLFYKLDTIPTDVLLLILAHLNPPDLIAAAGTCRTVRLAAEEVAGRITSVTHEGGEEVHYTLQAAVCAPHFYRAITQVVLEDFRTEMTVTETIGVLAGSSPCLVRLHFSSSSGGVFNKGSEAATMIPFHTALRRWLVRVMSEAASDRPAGWAHDDRFADAGFTLVSAGTSAGGMPLGPYVIIPLPMPADAYAPAREGAGAGAVAPPADVSHAAAQLSALKVLELIGVETTLREVTDILWRAPVLQTMDLEGS